MQGRFKFKKLAKYPHMKPEDVAVWERFIEKKGSFFDSVDYDMAVGNGRPQRSDLPENIRRDGKILTQRKIDVVGYNDLGISIVEIKPIADARALGQIEMYFDLFVAVLGGEGEIFKMVIAGDIEPDLIDTYVRQGVILSLV